MPLQKGCTNRTSDRYLRIAYRNGVISLSILGILFLCCAAISPRILVPGLAVILLLVLFLYALNLLLVIWRYYLLEKKNSPVPWESFGRVLLLQQHCQQWHSEEEQRPPGDGSAGKLPGGER